MARAFTCWLQAIVVTVAMSALAGACTPLSSGEPSLSDRVESASIIAYGKVRRQLPDTKYGYNLPNLFVAEFNVYCTYKGGPIPQIVNITGAGHVPGLCHHTRLKVGKKYVVMLDNRGDDLEPISKDIEVKNESSLARIYEMCGLELDYPSETQWVFPAVECPAPKPDGECVPNNPSGHNPPAQAIRDQGGNTTVSSSGVAITTAFCTTYITSFLISLT